MNSDSRLILESYAKDAGAIVKCPICGNYDISAEDEDAESQAYAMATNGWKAGEFGTDTRESVMDLMASVLSDANDQCPSCDREDD